MNQDLEASKLFVDTDFCRSRVRLRPFPRPPVFSRIRSASPRTASWSGWRRIRRPLCLLPSCREEVSRFVLLDPTWHWMMENPTWSVWTWLELRAALSKFGRIDLSYWFLHIVHSLLTVLAFQPHPFDKILLIKTKSCLKPKSSEWPLKSLRNTSQFSVSSALLEPPCNQFNFHETCFTNKH